MLRVALLAVARNEGPYIDEWVAYHRLLGFGPFLLYDNDSTDDTGAVLERLSDGGFVEALHWHVHNGAPPQRLAYADGLKRLRGRADWVGLIDFDEFFVLPKHDSIQGFLDEYGERQAIAVNWKLFGTSGHANRQPGLVIERFTRCSRLDVKGNRSVKTLARLDVILEPNVHKHQLRDGVVLKTLVDDIVPRDGYTEHVVHDPIRLNHYFTKSREEWDAKVARGRPTVPDGHPKKFRTEQQFRQCNRNEEEEFEIVRFIPAVKAEMRRLRSDVGDRSASATT